MFPNDLFVHLFGFFIAHSAAMHSKKSLNLIKNIYLVSLQNIMELSLVQRQISANLVRLKSEIDVNLNPLITHVVLYWYF